MAPELLLELSRYPLFPKTAADLIRVAGLEGAARIITAWGGQEWPVPARVGGATAKGQRRYAHLCEIVGDAVAQRVVAWCGGGMLNVPNLKEVKHSRAQQLVRAEYDVLTLVKGYSSPEAVFELGIKFDLAGRTVEKIIKRPDSELTEVAGQGILF